MTDVREVLAWIHEDELPSGYPYEAMFPYSKVDGVRLFPVYGPPERALAPAGEEFDKVLDELIAVARAEDEQSDEGTTALRERLRQMWANR